MFIFGFRVEIFLLEMIDLFVRFVIRVFEVFFEYVFSFLCNGYSFEFF